MAYTWKTEAAAARMAMVDRRFAVIRERIASGRDRKIAMKRTLAAAGRLERMHDAAIDRARAAA